VSDWIDSVRRGGGDSDEARQPRQAAPWQITQRQMIAVPVWRSALALWPYEVCLSMPHPNLKWLLTA
jgi:hypothetical protein